MFLSFLASMDSISGVLDRSDVEVLEVDIVHVAEILVGIDVPFAVTGSPTVAYRLL